jgi:hypothetical protein
MKIAINMTPEKFIEKWRGTKLNEIQSYQLHFNDVCSLVGYEQPQPMGENRQGKKYSYEFSLPTGKRADVYLQDHFIVEYKAPDKYETLKEAQEQVENYAQRLDAHLLVVTDINNWVITTNFFDTKPITYTFTHEELIDEANLRILQYMFTAPNALHPHRNRERVTVEAAKSFVSIVDSMRNPDYPQPTEKIASFLTKLIFCLFAEDVNLLPVLENGRGIFSDILYNTYRDGNNFRASIADLFDAMNRGTKVYVHKVRHFNGSLFQHTDVEALTPSARENLYNASLLNWEFVEPTVFGTVFERALHEDKRSQLGAHYTGYNDIKLIVEPVLMQPLKRAWQEIQTQAATVRQQYDNVDSGAERHEHLLRLRELRDTMLQKVRTITVLDPACGSGNFLYVALQNLLDLEYEIINDTAWKGIPYTDWFPEARYEVSPKQMYGIEKDKIAHALASIVVWIGYLQWKIHKRLPIYDPILYNPFERIVNQDAILDFDTGSEPEWSPVDVIIGNPPFLGRGKLRSELGADYVDKLLRLYANRVPGDADLVTYWFEKARVQLENQKVKRVGFIATNSIRQISNRPVLEKIVRSGNIFFAIPDNEWLPKEKDNAAVNVSIIGFDDGTISEYELDGDPVHKINVDLTGGIDITKAKTLSENLKIALQGINKVGDFDIPAVTATKILEMQNYSGVSNSEVVKPILNARDVVQQLSNRWIIDFGTERNEEIVKQYEAPYEYLKQHVYPTRSKNNRSSRATYWWLFGEPVPRLRPLLNNLSRYIVTPMVSKHRIFVFVDKQVIPDHRLAVIVRDDDYFFGVLNSKLHEIWSLRQGSTLEDRPAYTPTTTFETFPFPFVPSQENTASTVYQSISAAAKCLHEERQAWLNPQGVTAKDLKERTLTNLYNALLAYRKQPDKLRDIPSGIKAAAWEFASRLAELHDTLDRTVCDAYGWSYDVLADEEAILRHLLALNLERSGHQPSAQTPSDTQLHVPTEDEEI